MDQQTVEVSDFQFRALRRVRLFPPGTFQATGTTVPRWLATSSGLGLTVVATPSGELISFNTADVHNLLPGRTNLSVEVTDLPKKITPFRLSRQSAAASISLIDGSSDGKTLAIVATKPSTGDPFVFLYDFRLFSLQYTGEVYPYLEIRLSSSGGATATDLQWNPAIGNMFCASCSDGTLTTFTIDETDATKYSVVGTLRITDGSPLCISWSPKGKQLVVGLDNGIMKQLKPELAPVRQVPAPAGSVVRLPNDDVRCAGLCWLTTTEFAVAYAQKNTQAVVLTLLTVKKDGAPVWKSYDDICFGFTDRSPLPIAYNLQAINDWQVLLCASSCACEVGVLGKSDSGWMGWTMDDNARAELPVDANQRETWPIGAAIDLSSAVAIKLDDEGVRIKPPMPVLLLLTSDGLLLPYSVLSLNDAMPPLTKLPAPFSLQGIRCKAETSDPNDKTPMATASANQILPPTTTHAAAFAFSAGQQKPVQPQAAFTSAVPISTAVQPIVATTATFGTAAPTSTVAPPAFATTATFGTAPNKPAPTSVAMPTAPLTQPTLTQLVQPSQKLPEQLSEQAPVDRDSASELLALRQFVANEGKKLTQTLVETRAKLNEPLKPIGGALAVETEEANRRCDTMAELQSLASEVADSVGVLHSAIKETLLCAQFQRLELDQINSSSYRHMQRHRPLSPETAAKMREMKSAVSELQVQVMDLKNTLLEIKLHRRRIDHGRGKLVGMAQMSPSKSDNDLINRTLMNIQSLTKESAKKMASLRQEYQRIRNDFAATLSTSFSSSTTRETSVSSKHSLDISAKARSPKITAVQTDRLRAMFGSRNTPVPRISTIPKLEPTSFRLRDAVTKEARAQKEKTVQGMMQKPSAVAQPPPLAEPTSETTLPAMRPKQTPAAPPAQHSLAALLSTPAKTMASSTLPFCWAPSSSSAPQPLSSTPKTFAMPPSAASIMVNTAATTAAPMPFSMGLGATATVAPLTTAAPSTFVKQPLARTSPAPAVVPTITPADSIAKPLFAPTTTVAAASATKFFLSEPAKTSEASADAASPPSTFMSMLGGNKAPNATAPNPTPSSLGNLFGSAPTASLPVTADLTNKPSAATAVIAPTTSSVAEQPVIKSEPVAAVKPAAAASIVTTTASTPSIDSPPTASVLPSLTTSDTSAKPTVAAPESLKLKTEPALVPAASSTSQTTPEKTIVSDAAPKTTTATTTAATTSPAVSPSSFSFSGFGAGTGAQQQPASASTTTSLFGGGAGFGQKATTAFGGTSPQPQQPAAVGASVFGAAAAAASAAPAAEPIGDASASMDDGMSSMGFGGLSMSANQANAGGSVFGSGTKSVFGSFGQQKPAGGSVFGGASPVASNTGVFSGSGGGQGVFGGASPSAASSFSFANPSTPSSPFGGGPFSGGASTGGPFSSSTTTGSSAFGGGAFGGGAQQQQQQSGGGFGQKSAFGGGSAFGSKPAFGGTSPLRTGGSVFGAGAAPAPQQPAFGSSASTPQQGGFASFASSTTGFGALAASAQQPSGSVFGGGFGAVAQQQQNNAGSVFGGAPAPTGGGGFGGGGSFSSWR